MVSESIDQKSGFKTDWNQSYLEGARQVQGASGEMFRSFADGSTAINSGTGMNLSSGSRSFNISGSQEASLQQSLGNTLSSLRSDEQNYSKAKTSTISSMGDLVSHLAQREVAGESFNYDKMGEQGRALQQAVNQTKALHDNDNYGWSQAGSAAVKAYADGSLKMPDAVPLVKASAGVAAEASIEARNNSDQSLGRQETVATTNDTNKSFNNLVKAATNEQWLADNSIDTSYAQGTRANYDDMQTYGQQIAQKREEANTYSEAIQYNRNNGATEQRDMYHEVEAGVMRQYGVSQNQAHQMIEQNDPRANKVWDGIVQQNVGSTISQVRAGRNTVDAMATDNGTLFHNEHQSKVNDSNIQDLSARAANQGLSREQIQGNITGTKQDLQNKYGETTAENSVQYNSVLHANKVMGQALEYRADEYEKDRIGQGRFGAPVLAALAQVPTLGNAGSLDIGGPSSKERARLNLQENASQLPGVITNKNNNKND